MCYCLPLSLCTLYCFSLTNKFTPSFWPLHPRHTLLEPVPTVPQMWSSGGPNCSEQASPALKEWVQKRPTVTYRSLSATPLSEWTIAFLSHFRGGRVARLVWTVASVQRLVLCSFSFHSVPRWTSQGMFYSLQSSSQHHGSESLSHSSDLFSISRVTREDLLTSFQKWRCLRLTAWLLTLASENSTKNRDGMGSPSSKLSSHRSTA